MRTVTRALLTVFLATTTLALAYADPTDGSGPDASSKTKSATATLFKENLDLYLDVLDFSKIANPVVFLQFNPTTIGSSYDDTTRSTELGLGARWLPGVYGAAYLAYSGGTLGLANSDKTSTPITDSSGLQIGDQTTSNNRLRSTLVSNFAQTDLVGLALGNLTLGVQNQFFVSRYSSFGTYNQNVYNNQRGSYNSYNGTSTSQVLTINGVVAQQTITDIPTDGYTLSDTVLDKVLVGAKLPFGPFTLLGQAGLGYEYDDYSAKGGSTTVTTKADGGFTAFQGYQSVQQYAQYTTFLPNQQTVLSLPLSAGGELPFALLENPAVLKVLPTYTLTVTLPNTGEYQRNTSTTRQATVQNDHSVTNVDTTNVQTSSRTDAVTYGQTLTLPVKVTVSPSSGLRFAVQYKPTLTASGVTRNESSETVNTQVTDNGNGVDPALDSGDSTVVTKNVPQPYTVTTQSFAFVHELDTAVQLQLVKDVLRLNFGTRISSNPYMWTKSATHYTANGANTVTTTKLGVTSITNATPVTGGQDSSNQSFNGSATTTVASDLGLTLTVNPNLTFDFLANSKNVLDLFNTNGGGAFNLNNFTIQMTINLPPPSAPAAAAN